MTQPALISAAPWMHTEARDGLIERALVAEAHIGGVAVRLLPEPLKTTVDGVAVQALRVTFDDEATARAAGVPSVTSAGGELVVSTAPAPEAASLRLLVREVTEPTDVVFRAPQLGDGSITFTLLPQRDWSVHVVHHSHFDFGYTDPQATVIAAQRSYLDSAVELAARTADWPEASRFRWNAEALWAFVDWEKNRPAAQVAEFVRLVKEGSIGLSAMPYNLHTDTCSTEELHELLREARRIRDEYGITFTTAMQTDVPGQVAGLPDALSEVGVKYLAVAHNWAGRSQPHTSGALNLPRMFRWRSPAGNSLLVWMTDSPHGLAYMEGPMVGFTESYDVVDRYFPAYLTALATRGYPFPPGVFGAHGEEAEGRDGYPWDVLHLRTQGFMGDNGPARLHLAEIVRRWNETWTSPVLRVSRNEDFFEEAERRIGDDLITVEGDWGDWWVEGVGSAAAPLALARQAQAAVTDARSFSQAAAWLGAEAVPNETAEANAAYDSISMFNEHTWGASNSWTHGDEGYDSGERQWQWKVSQALIGHQRALDFAEHSLAYLAPAIAPGAGARASFVVMNASGQARTGLVRLLLKESTIGLEDPILIRDGRTNVTVAHVEEPQGNSLHRESGRWISFHAVDAPAFGYVRFDVHDAGAPLPVPRLPVIHSLVATPRAELLVLQNEFLRVEFDEQTASIRSIREIASGRELVNPGSVVGFNAYIYDQYGSSGAGFNHLANKLSVSDRLELLASRTLGKPAVLIERVSDAVEERLVYEFVADGVDSVRVTLRLRHGEPRLLIENRIAKPVTRTKESGYFAFPFLADDPVLHYEVSGGVTGDGIAHIPGAPQHMRAIRNWVTVEDGAEALAWVTKDAPLVQTGTIALPYAPFPASTSPVEPATIYSWVHNNVWDTNFPIEQGFTATFEYAVGVRGTGTESPEGLAIATTAELVRPLSSVVARGSGGTDDTSDATAEAAVAALLRLDDDRVQLLSVVAGEQPGTSVVRLQSFAAAPVTLRLVFGVPIAEVFRSSLLGDLYERLPLDEATATITLQPFEVAGVHVRR